MDKSLQWRLGVVLFVVLAAVYYLYPVQGHKINLGLDLQGGMHLILGVESEKAVDTALDRMVDEFQQILDDREIDYILVDKVDGALEVETLDRQATADIQELVQKEYNILNVEEVGDNKIDPAPTKFGH
jgi:preprotein translocase subunit SecD